MTVPTADETGSGPSPRKTTPFSQPAAWLVLSAIVGFVAALAVHLIFETGELVSLTLGFGGLCFFHVSFISTLMEAHQTSTRPRTLIRNLLFNVGFVIAFVAVYGLIFAKFALLDAGQSLTGDSWRAIYFSVITWTSVGDGDITPGEPFTRFLAGLEALNGYLVMSIFIATLLQTFMRLASVVKD